MVLQSRNAHPFEQAVKYGAVEEGGEGAADNAAIIPDDFGLQTAKPGKFKPAQAARLHRAHGVTGETGNRYVNDRC